MIRMTWHHLLQDMWALHYFKMVHTTLHLQLYLVNSVNANSCMIQDLVNCVNADTCMCLDIVNRSIGSEYNRGGGDGGGGRGGGGGGGGVGLG